MKREEEQNDRVLHLLKRCRPESSTPGRRERALAAARIALTAASQQSSIPSWRPLLRFATAVAITVVLVAFANFWDARALSRWQLPLAPQGNEAVPEIADTDPVLDRELLSLPAIRFHDADRMINNWIKSQELLHEMMDLEVPGISNSQDELPTTKNKSGSGFSRLMARNMPNSNYPTHNSHRSIWKD